MVAFPSLLLWPAQAQGDFFRGEARLQAITTKTAQLTCAITLDRAEYWPRG
jgi:hypothetical protein